MWTLYITHILKDILSSPVLQDYNVIYTFLVGKKYVKLIWIEAP